MDTSSTHSKINRRKFVAGSLTAFGASLILPAASFNSFTPAPQQLTVQQVVDLILKSIPGDAVDKTVDTLKSGNGNLVVTGIITTMFATVDVIKQAIARKANFIIAHEPTFYNHLDETAWLENDKVYEFKRKLLDDNNIAVWRFHDYWHRNDPDGIRMGVLTDLGWEKYYDPKNPRIVTLPATPLKNIIKHVKEKLGIKNLRIVGDPSQICQRVLLMPGASGGRSHIQQMREEEPDVLICGEVQEWETSEYVRDAISMGLKRSLIVLGHTQSEEPGMKWLVRWLQPKVGSIKVSHISANNPFTWA
jgi:putative NIF3 family GTP cyclohydrolase 1 type 2